MNDTLPIPKMVPPGIKQIIQVIVTSRCTLACSDCTQHIAHQKKWDMSPDNFRAACRSLADWHGVVGMFGGDCTLHPKFPELCQILVEEIPDRNRRGLWSNDVAGHGKLCHETFGYFNLVVHDKQAAADEMRATMPGRTIHGENHRAWHSPIMTAIKDLVPDRDQMWAMIAKCDINLNWSGAITVTPSGGIGAYFCEVAASFDNLYGEDHSLPVTPGWWRKGIEAFDGQVRRWCPDCGAAVKLKGHQDLDYIDDVSKTHLPRVQLTNSVAKGKRKIVVHESIDQAQATELTDYMRLRSK